jgi:hypothetical protein
LFTSENTIEALAISIKGAFICEKQMFTPSGIIIFFKDSCAALDSQLSVSF